MLGWFLGFPVFKHVGGITPVGWVRQAGCCAHQHSPSVGSESAEVVEIIPVPSDAAGVASRLLPGVIWATPREYGRRTAPVLPTGCGVPSRAASAPKGFCRMPPACLGPAKDPPRAAAAMEATLAAAPLAAAMDRGIKPRDLPPRLPLPRPLQLTLTQTICCRQWSMHPGLGAAWTFTWLAHYTAPSQCKPGKS